MKRPAPAEAPSSFILRSTVRLLFPCLNLFAAWLAFKGHDSPGGGFIGGLVSALSFVLLGMAFGVEEAQRRMRVDPLRLALLGLALAYGVSAAPLLFGRPFLEHFAWRLSLPGGAGLPLLTAQLFDIGVFLVVVGVVTKLVFAFSLSVQLKDPLPGPDRTAYAAPHEEPIEDAPGRAPAAGAFGPLRRKGDR